MGTWKRLPEAFRHLGIATLVWVAPVACGGDGPITEGDRLEPFAEVWSAILEAEDLRGTGADGIEPLQTGLESPSPDIRRIAVRGLGRLERSDLVPLIFSALSDPEASVRGEAANALAQAVVGANGPISGTIRDTLLQVAAREEDPFPRRVAAAALGRIPLSPGVGGGGRGGRGRAGGSPLPPVAQEVAATLLELAKDPADQTRLGGILGLNALSRQAGTAELVHEGLYPIVRDTLWLSEPARTPAGDTDALRRRAFRVGVATVVATGGVDADDLGRWLGDRDRYVRREAVLGIPSLPSVEMRDSLFEIALDDVAPAVRYEAFRLAAREDHRLCPVGQRAVQEGTISIGLLGLDLVGQCPTGDRGAAAYDSLARGLDQEGRVLASRALVRLAGTDQEGARTLLPSFAAHPNGLMRADAARAAAALGEIEVLRALVADSVANVREAAILGLSAVEGHAADEIYMAQLTAVAPETSRIGAEWPQPQVVMAAARALRGSSDPAAPEAILTGLGNLTEVPWESARDARLALLAALEGVGSSTDADRLTPYLDDYDPQIASRAADLIEGWTGQRPNSNPSPPPRLPLPTFREIADLEGAQVVLELSGLGEVRIALHPFEAPTNAWRFASLVDAGALDGLTFHRVVPNFVVQGGSPLANEYAGHGAFTRDELGIEGNWRGTVGVSTRGHDTGDGQIYINLIDNLRLDHQYTTFGEVVRGLELVDLVEEGAVIHRATLSRSGR